ncbi:MAG: ABC transporter ATP-binding protein [Clostridia bacterium]|nr:ABC transporter ATP-binding protein [Clostridia bacterium]
MAVIEVNHLKKYYGKHRGIEDVSFSVQEGEIFGFIGPNGAGKSTTIRTLLGLIFPTSGSATVFGRDCIRDGAAIRADIGYLPSEVFYYDNMKVLDVFRYSAGFYPGARISRALELAEALDLDVTKRVEDLSYGNKKKVGIVQGLLHEPKLIILDEPTSGLDPLMQQTFFDLIVRENRNGATVLFSSHILPEVQKLCTRVAIIKDGVIIREEDMATLRSDAYKKFLFVFREDIPEKLFEIPGVSRLSQSGREARFLFRGNISDVVSRVGGLEIANLLAEDPDLEEIFLHYYQKEG